VLQNVTKCDTFPKIYQFLVVGVIALVLSAFFDARVAAWVNARELGPAMHKSPVAAVIKWPGVFYFTMALAGVIALADRRKRRAAVVLLVSGALAGLFYTLAKWCVGRTRPYKTVPAVPPFEFHPFQYGVAGLWKAHNQAFPSGHACLAFATAAALAMTYPRGKVIFWLVAAAVGVERVLEGAHYPSDVVAGAIFGVLAAWGAGALGRRLLRERAEPRGFEVLPPTNGRHP
jgi:membrane-associated phospholipid phosphatase